MNKISRFIIASSFVLLAIIIFSFHYSYAQPPKLLLKFVEKQSKIQSGYVKFESIYLTDNDTTNIEIQEAFYISSTKDIKYLSYSHSSDRSNISCKLAHTVAAKVYLKNYDYTKYRYKEHISDAKEDVCLMSDFSYPTAYNLSFLLLDGCSYQHTTPKINKKNIRYKIVYPNSECGSNRISEWEFDRKTFQWIQNEYSINYFETENIYGKIDILEQRLYEYIHPDILDTISFKFEELKKEYDLQSAVDRAKRDSAFCANLYDSIAQSITKNAKWVENIPQDTQKDTLFFMPEWKFSSLSGDTIYSDSINSQFLLIDMWYISCHPCRMVMRELATIDTLYDESLLKMVSINVSDKDTVKIAQVVRNINLKCEVALAYNSHFDVNLSKQMGSCQGYPQLYLIDMKTRQIIWHSCGWYKGFTKDIEEILKEKNEKKYKENK